ncbi:hypothetical protein SAMN04488697_104348 [Pseudomonas sp. 43mfcvi1.1]|nr:hypothetical protein ATJ40_104348 [Pseudomonas sp. 43mfcvi1.1]SSB96274.1 hypothetical protein SAMN04488697_104348 [Pseudomonas sp. 43mfcvi1.1]
MPKDKTPSSVVTQQLQMTLSKWDTEDAAKAFPIQGTNEIPELSNAELVHLRVRVIALENLVIALLAQGTDQQLAVAREMAGYITPRPGFYPAPFDDPCGIPNGQQRRPCSEISKTVRSMSVSLASMP